MRVNDYLLLYSLLIVLLPVVLWGAGYAAIKLITLLFKSFLFFETSLEQKTAKNWLNFLKKPSKTVPVGGNTIPKNSIRTDLLPSKKENKGAVNESVNTVVEKINIFVSPLLFPTKQTFFTYGTMGMIPFGCLYYVRGRQLWSDPAFKQMALSEETRMQLKQFLSEAGLLFFITLLLLLGVLFVFSYVYVSIIHQFFRFIAKQFGRNSTK